VQKELSLWCISLEDVLSDPHRKSLPAFHLNSKAITKKTQITDNSQKQVTIK
jgi:hypothetical protein